MMRIFSLFRFKFSERKIPSNSTCWNCKSNEFKNLFICGSCHILQKPEITLDCVNYFEMFDLPVDMGLKPTDLNSKYRELQKIIHPDKFIPLQNKDLLRYSEHYSSAVNEAYHTLKHPAKRAEYILKLNGFKITEEQKFNDLAFMEEIIELQEQIEEAADIERDKIKKYAQDYKKKMLDSLTQQLSEKRFQEAFEQLLYLKYFDRLIDQAEFLEDSSDK